MVVSKAVDIFICDIGVGKGGNLSPPLFAIYLNDVISFLSNAYMYKCLDKADNYCQTYLSERDRQVFFKLYTVLYADDIIIFAENAQDLQTNLNAANMESRKETCFHISGRCNRNNWWLQVLWLYIKV